MKLQKRIETVLAMILVCLFIVSCNNQEKKDRKADSAESKEVVSEQQQPVQEDAESLTQGTEQPAPEEELLSEYTYANIAGTYDSYNEDGGNESRIVLLKDGTATWCMIGSLNFTEYTYTIHGNTICLKYSDDTEEDCYEYDANTRSLRNEQGAVYYRQVDF